ncbi:MAG: hypothetical protein HS101_00655 [Planctomycetia bacterium]|jgi:hypothetical protein|nr:hypothetical protein [Planctomycetia bacterium]MCC7313439.1 hypothetical protein [Planctomycetota bacterium]OQZ05646.1 MAG: hypothetical protein B6D36_09065 [Planctomycetes bacterium UTPLA1]
MSLKTFGGLVVGALATVLMVGACEKNETPPAKSAEKPATEATDAATGDKGGDDLGAFLSKDKPAGTSSALPPGHPPIEGAAKTAAPQTAQGMPPSHPPVGDDAAEAAPLHWDQPIEWKPEQVTSSMRVAQYLIPRAAGDDQDGQMIVFHFGAGQGGPTDMNIARWRSFFTNADGSPVGDDAAKVEKSEISGMKVTVLDVAGKYSDPMMAQSGGKPIDGEARLLAAIVETPSGSWFFKAVGPKKTIGENEPVFRKLISSIK